MKRVLLAALAVVLVSNAAAYAAVPCPVEQPTLQTALQAKQVDLWNKIAREKLLKKIPQYCDHSCSNDCLDLWNSCEINCQMYFPPSYCNPYCESQFRNCMCVNQCCGREPVGPGEPDYCS